MNILAIGSFIFFTVLVAVISWYFTKDENLETNTGYFLGGRSLSGVVIAGSFTSYKFINRTISWNEWKCFYGWLISYRI